jgi:cyanate permease
MGAELLIRAATPPLRDRAVGVMSIGIGIAAGTGPFVLGALADATSTHQAFLVVPALMVGALGILGYLATAARRSIDPAAS